MCASISSRSTPGTYSFPNTRTYGAPSACARSMKRRASSSCAACLTGSMSCICADAPRQETTSPCAASCRFASPIRSGASSGTLVRSMFSRMPRSSTAANWCSAAKSRIRGQGQVGQPRVEKPSGNFLGARQGSSSAAVVPTNSLRVVIACSESSFRVTVTATRPAFMGAPMITAVLVLSLLQSPSNTLTPAERAAGWRLLFDGRTLAGWRGLGYDTVPTAHWVVVNGVIKKIASGDVPRVADGRPLVGGDLMTVDSFADFELTFEWKVTPGANSGVKYNVSEVMSMAQGGAGTQGGPTHSALGFEYQMLDDDRHEDGKLPSHRAGALYDLIAPNEQKHLRPVGEWNRSRIVFRGNHGEHWLNGEKVVEFELGTARMDSLLGASKYKTIPEFGEKRRRGHIVLQDHGDEVYFRSIKVRPL